jgi:hypothetical protein
MQLTTQARVSLILANVYTMNTWSNIDIHFKKSHNFSQLLLCFTSTLSGKWLEKFSHFKCLHGRGQRTTDWAGLRLGANTTSGPKGPSARKTEGPWQHWPLRVDGGGGTKQKGRWREQKKKTKEEKYWKGNKEKNKHVNNNKHQKLINILGKHLHNIVVPLSLLLQSQWLSQKSQLTIIITLHSLST